ncbi:MAG: 3'-5' exonuclease [Bacteroidota bacterium]
MANTIYDKHVAYVDVETTGLDWQKHEIIQIAILVENQKTGKQIELWSTRIKPSHIETADEIALEINGYKANPELWDDAPVFDKKLGEKIQEKLEGHLLAGHNFKFDNAFLEKRMRELGTWKGIGHHSIDTVTLAIEHLGPMGVKSVSLKNVCEFLGISNVNAHDALVDVFRCREVYHKLKRAGWVKKTYWRFKKWLKDRRAS